MTAREGEVESLDVLGSFIADLRYDLIPKAIRDRASVIILDAFASALAGRREEGCNQIEALATAMGKPVDSTVIGGASSSLAGAILVNGYQIACSSVCDFHRESLSHVTPNVIPPVLAVAERQKLTGSDFLVSVVVGLETSVRLGRAIGAVEMRDRGWYPSGIVGPIGAAAALASLRRLDIPSVRNALSLAGTQSSGTLAHQGTSALMFQQSHGAFSALLAALLAERGFQASGEILTARRGGMFNIFSDGGSPDVITSDIGKEWMLNEISLRRWSVPDRLQALVDELLSLVHEERIESDDVVELNIAVSGQSFKTYGEGSWTNPFDARCSIQYVAVVALIDRQCGPVQFQEERVRDPLLNGAIREIMCVAPDDTLSGDETRITLRTREGRSITRKSHAETDDPRVELDWAEVETKFLRAGDGLIHPSQAERAIQMVSDLANLHSVEDLSAQLSGPALIPPMVTA